MNIADSLNYIVANLVDSPKKINIEQKEENGVLMLTIHVASEDMGKIIGKEGKIIRAIRNIMKIPAIKENKRINIFLSENT